MNPIMQLPKQFQEQDIAFSYWMKEAPNDTFVVTAFAVDEAIFGMTRIEVMLSSSDDNIDLQALLDSPGTLTIHHKYMETLRHFSGVVVEAERGDRGHHRTAYRLVLMPSLYRLDHGSDCRVFQTKKVGDIVKELFSEHGIENVTWDIDEGSHDAREYCVQYRESHLGFVERILAEEGIFYYFEHDKEGLLKLIISDKPNVLHDCPGLKEIEYNSLSSGSVKGLFCSSLSYREKLRATTVVQRDYTFKNPVYNQEHKERTANPNGEKHDYELYDYPGRYKKDSAGKAFTRYKLEATRVDASLGYGVSNAPHLLTGHAITLFEHPDDRLNQKWRLLTIRHEGVQPQAWGEDAQGIGMADTGIVAPGLHGTTLSGLSFGTTSSHSPNLLTQSLNRRMGLAVAGNNNASDNATVYANAFAVQPSHLPYRAPQTNKPLIDGPQIATVVGPEGEEIHTDQYGRVKVHFPWDRHKDPKAEDSSCWIRVSMNWGGGKYGHVALPRIGHEVIVDFLEGDPDQPIIIGRTYHASNQPPYNLPEDKTKMVIRSNSHKADGFNEISFEDEGGQENMFVHAQKDQSIKVLNNRAKRVEANELESIGANKSVEVANNHQEKIGGSVNRFIGSGLGSLTAMLGPILAAGAKDTEIGSEAIDNPFLKEFAKGHAAATLAGEATSLLSSGAFNAAAGHFVKAGFDMATKGSGLSSVLSQIMPLSGIANTMVEKFQSDTIGIARTEQIGSYKNTSVGHTMTLNIGEEFIIKVGNSRFIMDKEGNVTITGTRFNFSATGAVNINGKVIDLN
ncbi:type VI secretion system Vgr family protein [Bartonella sp. HY406]|uniref:type VI secretion system Vgr family protein n=1 Tax=Bartonella sp. HY406 TaxID=2979331 RepID=UPI0021C9893C|nr:type VI secretion system tip protein TssI/VgrG [Bartonella sp. HY406]UXN04804.1 type VI secretion system tip protein VgrG [Bartonella sp. HY406]